MRNANPYAYAKACGIIGKSFVGNRISQLAGLHSLSELERLIFPELHRRLTGRELLADMERRIARRAVQQILKILASYDKPPELLVRMLRAYEYSDLKACLHYIASRKDSLPPLCDIGQFRTIHFEAFPDIAAMIKGTEFESLLLKDLKTLQQGVDTTHIETKLDIQYYQSLIDCLPKLSAEDRAIVKRILTDEFSLRNCIWALRLRTYYRKSPEETNKFLVNIKTRDHSLAAEAVKSLGFPLDFRPAWKGWRWEKFLNPEVDFAHWTADPRYFENAASQYLYKLAMRYFHIAPIEISSIFCFIKIKQFEEDLLTSIAEGLALGIDSTGVFKLLEVSL